ncbi:MAG: hypothetical protein HQ582_13440 [Planctomycetes bacterium]|nr:hypothetical protein [Planctomycetota bacterium]
MKEYDLFVPLYYNDGSPVEAEKLFELKRRLLNQFDGLTFFPQANEGFWRAGGVTYRDEIVVFRILTADAQESRRFLSQFKQDLKKELNQEEILIVERDVETL